LYFLIIYMKHTFFQIFLVLFCLFFTALEGSSQIFKAVDSRGTIVDIENSKWLLAPDSLSIYNKDTNKSVSIGTSTADGSAILNISATDKGFLPPRLTTTMRGEIASPAIGLCIFNTTTNAFEVNLGTISEPSWQSIANDAVTSKKIKDGTINTLDLNSTATIANATNTAITNDISGTDPVYPTFVTGTTGNLSQQTAGSKLSFIPSTGTLSATNISATNGNFTGILKVLKTGNGSNNSIITQDDNRKIFIGRDKIQVTNLDDEAATLGIQSAGGAVSFGGAATFASTVESSTVSIVESDANPYGLKITNRNINQTYSLGVDATAIDDKFFAVSNISNGTIPLKIAPSGAATFASSVTATEGNFSGLVTISDRLDLNDNDNNIFIGKESGMKNTTGGNNVASGSFSMGNNTTGDDNVASGSFSMGNNKTGNANVASGHQSLYTNDSGSKNVASGYQSLFKNTIGNNNVSLGFESLYDNISGNNNVAAGYQSLYTNISGSKNVASGYQSLFSNKTGNNNVALGVSSLYYNISGNNNVASGYESLYTNESGSKNVASGYHSLYTNLKGNDNVASGYESLYANTIGSNNVAVGSYSMRNNTTGDSNIALGYESLKNNSEGSSNIASGYKSLVSNISGNGNIASGYQSLLKNTTGDHNIALGAQSLSENTEGSNNVAYGLKAGQDTSDSNTPNTVVSNSIFIGANTKANANGETNQIVIGDSATGNGSNTITLGGELITNTYLKGAVLGSGSATFASTVSATDGNFNGNLVVGNISVKENTTNLLKVVGDTDNIAAVQINQLGEGNIINVKKDGDLQFSIENDGKATFASSVSATDGLFSGIINVEPSSSVGLNIARSTSSNINTSVQFEQLIGSAYIGVNSLGDFVFNTIPDLTSSKFKVSRSGAATFASSVSATDNIYLNSSTNSNITFQESGETKWIAGYVPFISAFRFSNGSADVLTLNNDQSASFASSVSATDGLFSGNVGVGSVFTPGSLLQVEGTTTNAALQVNQQGTGVIVNVKQSGNTKFLIDNAGAATFASSVSATDGLLLTGSAPILTTTATNGTSGLRFDILGSTSSTAAYRWQYSGTTIATLSGLGAATFASSVTATEFIGDGAKLTGIYRQLSYTVNTEYAELGGYVIQISPNGKHGLVVAMQDQGTSNWYEANNLVSNAFNHDAAGKEFSDWRLPTKRELALLHAIYKNGNAAELNARFYWSSTANDNDNAWRQNLFSVNQYSTNKGDAHDVRAVRAF
jgi:hypothetical protein